MYRYLLNLSYIGTKYSGVTKQSNLTSKNGQSTIQHNLEEASQKLRPKPINPIELHFSSRTDAGVHALNSTAHIDLERSSGKPYYPVDIVSKLNNVLTAWKEPIRVNDVRLVKPDFSAQRDATNRTYLYRLAVPRKIHDKKVPKQEALFNMFIPIEEQRRCHFILNNGFDIERAREAAEMFIGLHDFRSLMSVSREHRTLHPLFALREMRSITIRPGRTIATPDNYEKTINEHEFWEFEFNARSYIYRQIRRTMGVIIAAGEGHITARDVYEMITIPSKHSWIKGVTMAPAHGLYLANVEYPDDLFETNIDIEPNYNVSLAGAASVPAPFV